MFIWFVFINTGKCIKIQVPKLCICAVKLEKGQIRAIEIVWGFRELFTKINGIKCRELSHLILSKLYCVDINSKAGRTHWKGTLMCCCWSPWQLVLFYFVFCFT